MKRIFVFSFLLLMACATSCSLERNKKTRHITYQEFIDKIWDFETYHDSFTFKGNTAVIVDFYASWCGPCMNLLPIIEKLAEEYEGELTIYKVNVDKEPALAKAFRVKGLPVLFFIPTSGKSIKRHDGLPSESDLRYIIENQLLDHPKEKQ